MAISNILDKMKELAKLGPYKYQALPENVTREEVQKRAQVWADRHKKAVRLTLAVMAMLAIGYFVLEFKRATAITDPKACDTPNIGYQCSTEVSHAWGQYSPYYAVPSAGRPGAVPEGCALTFAQVLSRHGARAPTAGKSALYADLVRRLRRGRDPADFRGPAAFLRDYDYALGADELTEFGRRQMRNSGIYFYRRYGHLVRDDGRGGWGGDEDGDEEKQRDGISMFVRSAGQKRVVDSAREWAEGFHQEWEADTQKKHRHGKNPPDHDDGYPYDILVIPEGPEVNNTLSDELCKAFEEGPDEGEAAQEGWLAQFAAPIADRVNAELLPGANLSLAETVHLMDLCPFDTVGDGRAGRLSPFCGLFAVDEWRSYDYHASLGKWYGYGSGSALAPTRGVGFANELVARLTGRPVEDATSTNATLDGDPRTFPLGRRLYADFSHDNDMSGIYAAMGLYNATEDLPLAERRGPGKAGGYSASWSVPFAARMYVEKMACGGDDDDDDDDDDGEELVRVLVNDRVIPLQNCDADELGRCRLSKFVESLSFARQGGHWDQCFA